MQIIPAELTHTEIDFIEQLLPLLPHFSHFHIDIADGKFVPNTTIQIEEISEALFTLPKDDLDKLSFDFHLMVKDVDKEIEKLQFLSEKIAIKTVFVHISVIDSDHLSRLSKEKFAVGLVLNPEDSVESLSRQYNLESIPSIQLMTVHPGFQGSAFVPEVLNKVEQLRTQHYRNKIYLDGAINENSLVLVKKYQDQLEAVNVGSYLIHSSNITERISTIRSILG